MDSNGFAMQKEFPPQPVQEFVLIAELRPTQVTIGMREVQLKRARWRNIASDDAARLSRTKSIPIILGPDGARYMVDRHHLARALIEERVDYWSATVITDFSKLSHGEFWASLERQAWTHPFDDTGRRVEFGNLPKSILELTDDPYRSLAGALKRMGVYKKDKVPFSEFRWANFLRSRIERGIVDRDFDLALRLAVDLIRASQPMSLPVATGAQHGSTSELVVAA
jgi:hypothetical protein